MQYCLKYTILQFDGSGSCDAYVGKSCPKCLVAIIDYRISYCTECANKLDMCCKCGDAFLPAKCYLDIAIKVIQDRMNSWKFMLKDEVVWSPDKTFTFQDFINSNESKDDPNLAQELKDQLNCHAHMKIWNRRIVPIRTLLDTNESAHESHNLGEKVRYILSH